MLGDVIDDDGLNTHVGVDEDRSAEEGIQGGVERAGGEGCEGKGHQGCGQSALEGPVVVAVGWGWCRDGRGIVDGALDDLGTRRKEVSPAACVESCDLRLGEQRRASPGGRSHRSGGCGSLPQQS